MPKINQIPKPLKNFLGVIASKWPFPVATSINGHKLWVDLRSAIGRGIYVNGEFDEAIYEAALPFLQPGNVVADVGANIGYYTLKFAEKVGGEGQVEAFEVDQRALRCLKRTLSDNQFSQIYLNEFGLSDQTGRISLERTNELGHTRLSTTGDGPWVETKKLDEHISAKSVSQLDLIKIDVEGAELRVLEGAIQTLETLRPSLIVEVVDEHLQLFNDTEEKLFTLLKDLRYEIQSIPEAHTRSILAVPSRD